MWRSLGEGTGGLCRRRKAGSQQEGRSNGSGWSWRQGSPSPQAGYVDVVTGLRVEMAGFLQALTFSKLVLSIYLILEPEVDAEDTESIIHDPHFRGAQS